MVLITKRTKHTVLFQPLGRDRIYIIEIGRIRCEPLCLKTVIVFWCLKQTFTELLHNNCNHCTVIQMFRFKVLFASSYVLPGVGKLCKGADNFLTRTIGAQEQGKRALLLNVKGLLY